MKRSTPHSGNLSLDYTDISNAIEKRLFIGKVPPGSTDDELQMVFQQFGTLTECRVVPDRGGGSNGIGFVSFDSWGAAHRALLEADGKMQLRGHSGSPSTIVVSFAERTSVVGRGGGLAYAKGLEVNRVFVGSLPDDASEPELIQAFGICGYVKGASLLPAKSRSRCGFVNFDIWGEALDAVERLNGQPLRPHGEPMTVVLAHPKDGVVSSNHVGKTPSAGYGSPVSGSGGYEPESKRRRVDTGGSGGADLGVLLAAYAAAVNSDSPRTACDILHEQLMQARDQAKAAPRGDYSSSTPKFQVLGTASPAGNNFMGGSSLTGMSGTGAGAGNSGGGDGGARLFIGGLPHDSVDDDLASLASQLNFPLPPQSCQILECRVLPGKGCGYLAYSSHEAAEEAYLALQGRQVEGWTSLLRVQWATPKSGPGSAEPPRSHYNSAAAANAAAAVMQQPQGQLDPICFASQPEVEAQGLEPTRLFIGHIARDAYDAGTSLRPVFETFGQLAEWRWVQEKGVLYASYTTFPEAQAAMQAMCYRTVPGVSKSLNVKFSSRRF